MLKQKQMKALLAFAHQVADAVGEIHRQYYRQAVNTEYKNDSSPVTQADQEAERRVREMIMLAIPEHGIRGEEYPPHQADAEFVWIIDPVDGTKYFMTGHPLFALLLGLAYRGKFILGVIDQPISHERWTGADGLGSFLNGQLINARKCPTLDKAILVRPGFEWHTEGRDHIIDRLWKSVHWTQWGVPPYDYGLLASGHIDIVINHGAQVHDFAALEPVIRNAGGVMTDWYGNQLTVDSASHILALGNPALLDTIVKVLEFKE